MSFARESEGGEKIFAVLNFGDKEEKRVYAIEKTDMILNSDDEIFGGNGRCFFEGEELRIPPLSAAILSKKVPFFEKTIDYSADV